MTDRSATPATFTIEHRYDAAPARVYAAWTAPDAKKHWFIGPEDYTELERTLDFRVGGEELLSGRWPDGTVSSFEGRYADIVPNERIIFSYAMRLDQTLQSVSLATVEFEPEGAGTRLTFTEQVVNLDGFDDPDALGRKHGTLAHFERLETYLRSSMARA